MYVYVYIHKHKHNYKHKCIYIDIHTTKYGKITTNYLLLFTTLSFMLTQSIITDRKQSSKIKIYTKAFLHLLFRVSFLITKYR